MALGVPSHKVAHTMHIKAAVEAGDISRLEKLLKNYNGLTTINTALCTASSKGYFEIVKLLVKHGASITTSKNMPIICAATNGHTDIVKYFLENGANCTARFNRAIMRAAENGHLEVVKLLLENGADCTDFNNGAILFASKNGHTDIVKLLIENGANPNADNQGAFAWAIRNGHVETVKLLDKNDPSHQFVKIKDSVFLAAQKGYVETIKYLLYKIPNDTLPDVFAHACKSGNLEFVKYLYEYGNEKLSNMGCHICDGCSLLYAIDSSNLNIVNFLFEQDYDYADQLDISLALAAEKGHLEIIKLLVDKGANCNATFKDTFQLTAVESATKNNHLEAVEFLINQGAAKTPKQKVKLIEIAAAKGYMDIVEFLLNRVKKVNLNMAIKYATQNGHVEISKLLIRHTFIHTSKDFDAQIEMIAKLTHDILCKH